MGENDSGVRPSTLCLRLINEAVEVSIKQSDVLKHSVNTH